MTESSISNNKPKARRSKQDWLRKSLEILEKSGIEAVRVERIADQLEVSKSGFYYHFSDRSELYTAMLDYWLTLDMVPFLQERIRSEASPAEQLNIVSEVVDQMNLSRYDASIRQWAQYNPKVRRVWRKEMGKRIAHIRGLFEAIGFTGDELEARVRLFVAYTTSERELFSDLSTAERRKLREVRNKILVEF